MVVLVDILVPVARVTEVTNALIVGNFTLALVISDPGPWTAR